MKINGLTIVRAGGITGRGKVSEVLLDFRVADSGAPFADAFGKINAAIPAGVVGLDFAIRAILRDGCQPQVTAAVVQRFPISVINNALFGCAEDKPMQTDPRPVNYQRCVWLGRAPRRDRNRFAFDKMSVLVVDEDLSAIEADDHQMAARINDGARDCRVGLRDHAAPPGERMVDAEKEAAGASLGEATAPGVPACACRDADWERVAQRSK